MSIKVLQLGKFYPIRGGVEKVMLDLTEGLSARGVDCDMLCACEHSQEIRLNEHGRILCAKSWLKLAATMISPAMVITLRRIAKQYDIIHVHHPDPMACLALFLSGYKGKVVLHWHSDILKQKVLLKFYRPLQDWLIRRADIIVGTTPIYVKESSHLQEVQDKTDFIPIGIRDIQPDTAKVNRIRDMYAGKKIVYSLGRLVGYKGYEHLIDAAAHLSEDYLVLIGGQGPLKEKLQQRIEEKGLGHKVKLLGFIQDEDMPSYFGACDVFCLSSVWKTEAFAIVQIEAMACGKPIVATNIPGSGVSWVNRHGYSGLNVAIEDGEALAKAITVLTDAEVYGSYSEQSRKRYEEYFSYDLMIGRCMDLYEKIEKKKK